MADRPQVATGSQEPVPASSPAYRAVADVQAPKGTFLITFLYLLAIAALWGFMYLRLLHNA